MLGAIMMIEEILELAGVLMMSLATLIGAACAMRFSPPGIRLLSGCMYCAMALWMMPEPVNPLQYWLTHQRIESPGADILSLPVRYNSVAPCIERLFL
jgi:uncharacterized membrane protein YfcA